MAETMNISARIIEALFVEGLVLADEVHAAFDLPDRHDAAEVDAAQIALSCEALRTTTRMMHAMAWLINYRAYFRNEISDFQLRRYGRIAARLPESAPKRLALLPVDVQHLIRATERFYARIVRLDTGWLDRHDIHAPVPALQRLRDRLTRSAG